MALFPIKRPSAGDLGQWDPFTELSRLNERMSQMMDFWRNGEKTGTLARWFPALDVIENEKNLILKLDTPGLESKDIKVEVNEGQLTISGERKQEKEEKNEEFTHIERSYGSFMRVLPLPDYVNFDSIDAECKQGVLTVKMDKIPGRKKEVKSIPVH
ncbi:Hsp20/alpha crystallin family protein [Marinobacter caseinilyticus]|uniref:Hsp20/alpha crystallin family protein n=1 Tax=Marinobacter caseinilyticus TaxID=2692195 RepID=UPI0014079480|nr:Hsp20/alpha crystallin family protein [Marinobacter caseinilyticus]